MPLRLTMTPGLPPDESPLAYIGRDALGRLYLLRWLPVTRCYAALGWEHLEGRPWPVRHQLTGDLAGLIAGHVELPEAP